MTIECSLAMPACSAVPSASPRDRVVSRALLALVPPMTPTAGVSVLGAGAVDAYATHSQKRFATAGIDTNVWPLGPQEWKSG